MEKGKEDIRKKITFICLEKDIKKWEIAEKLGITESYFSKILRRASDKYKEEIENAIKEILEER